MKEEVDIAGNLDNILVEPICDEDEKIVEEVIKKKIMTAANVAGKVLHKINPFY